MITREEVERILVEHGVAPTDDDEVIKSALLRANWQDNDVQTALIVLRENVHTHEQHVDAVQNLFRGKAKLNASDINALLGIEVDIKPEDIRVGHRNGKMPVSYGQIVEIVMVTFAISLIFILGGMWIFKVGLFYESMV